MKNDKPIIVAVITNGSIFVAYTSCEIKLIEINNDLQRIWQRPTYQSPKEINNLVPCEDIEELTQEFENKDNKRVKKYLIFPI